MKLSTTNRDLWLRRRGQGGPHEPAKAARYSGTSMFRASERLGHLAGRTAQDHDLWLRLAEGGELMNLPDALLRYRVHEGQVSVSKIVAQRRAAELYRLLALQRRGQGHEDLDAAWAELKAHSSAFRATCAQDMLHCAQSFDRQARTAEARSMRWKAVRTAPFSSAVRRMLMDRIHWRLVRASSTET